MRLRSAGRTDCHATWTAGLNPAAVLLLTSPEGLPLRQSNFCRRGGFSGMQTLPLKVFRAIPGGSVRIPLLIGTASSRSRLGYTVPPGEWGIQVTLTLGPDPRDSPRRRTPILPLTITA
jgi:hypothetical protein